MQPTDLQPIIRHRPAACPLAPAGPALVLGLLGAAAAAGEEAATGEPSCAPDGAIEVALYGAIRADLGWAGSDLGCDGMPRPEGRGARLRFSGAIDGRQRLTFIIALPGLEAGKTARELRATVTIIEEDRGRFFSNGEMEICWSDIEVHDRVPGVEGAYRLGGIVYCAAPLAELNGGGGVSFTDLRFSGRLDWSPSQ